AITHALEASHANVINEANNAINDLNKITAAQRRGDTAGTASGAKEFVARAQKLNEVARIHASKIDDPVRQKQVLDAIAEIERLIPIQVNQLRDTLTA